jgi:DNA-binding IclR family transcriptional regulator
MGARRRNARVIVAQLLADVLRLRHRAYYPELRFIETVEITVILMAIFSAECDGKPLTALGLAKHLEMPRATLLRRLSFLEAKGEIRRGAEGFRVNATIFATPSRDEAIRGLRQTIIDAGNALSKLQAV